MHTEKDKNPWLRLLSEEKAWLARYDHRFDNIKTLVLICGTLMYCLSLLHHVIQHSEN